MGFLGRDLVDRREGGVDGHRRHSAPTQGPAGAFDREHYGLRETAIWQAEAWPATEVDEAFEVEGRQC